MDIYLQQQQQQQMKSQMNLENHAGIQNLNYSQMPQPNNSSHNLQFVPQQVPQSSMIYPSNSIQVTPNNVNFTQNEHKQIAKDSQKEQPSGALKSSNSIDFTSSSNSQYFSNSKSPSTSQEFQSSSIDSQTEININNSDNIKIPTTISSENAKKKQNQSQNFTLKEIIGIAPNAGPDHQHVFVCRFSDSVNNEYVANKQMRKRFSLQLIKFYESHIEERIPRPNNQQTDSSNIT